MGESFMRTQYNVECPTKEECDEMLSYLERQNKTADIVERAIDYGGILAAFMISLFVIRIMIGV